MSDTNNTSVNDAIDCHAHIFPVAVPEGSANAPRADQMVGLPEYLSRLEAHGVSRGVLVQPSAYGFDNGNLLKAISTAAGRLKGIAVVDPRISRDELLGLKRSGIVGLRFIVAFDRDILKREPERRLLQTLVELDMLAEVMVSANDFEHARPTLEEIPVKVVFDHLGWPNVRKPVDDPNFAAFLRFGRKERSYVKLSNLTRISQQSYPFEDLRPFVQAILEAFGPERCVWGSDWPFIHVDRDAMDFGRAMSAVLHLIGDPAACEDVFKQTPGRLFKFS